MPISATVSRRPTRPDHSLNSKVILPGDARFDDARRAWNLAVDQRTITFVMTLAGLQLGRVISRFVPIRIRCDLLVGVALVIEAVVFGLWALFVSPGRHRAGGMGWLARIRLPGSTWALIRRSRW